MARPEADSRVRRMLMQGIMWAILALTVGLAALVNARQRAALDADLGEPRQFEGFSVRLPAKWNPSHDPDNPRALIELHEPYFQEASRVISISIDPTIEEPTLSALGEVWAKQRTTRSIEPITVGDAEGILVVRREQEMILPGYSAYRSSVTVSRMMPGGKLMNIVLMSKTRATARDVRRDVDLMKRVAASVKVPGP